jgi:hypothetical protein
MKYSISKPNTYKQNRTYRLVRTSKNQNKVTKPLDKLMFLV